MEQRNKTLPEAENLHRVILVWNYVEWGGAQIYFLSIIKNAPKNWRFTIILPRNSKPDIIRFFEPFGVEFDFIDTQLDALPARSIIEKIKRQWRRIISETVVYRHLLKYELNKSIVHIEVAPWQSWILLFFLTRLGNVFVTMHNALPDNVSKWRKLVWKMRLNFIMSRRNFHFFAANQNAIDSLMKFVKPKYWVKLVLTRASINLLEIKGIVDSNRQRHELRNKFDLPLNKFIVLCVGQFVDRKGRWVFLETVRQVAAINRDILFVWLAPQMPNAADHKKIAEFEINDSFRFLLSESVGKTHIEVLQFFRVADIFVLPSLWEGLPIAILEAMALGIPTVSTDVNAIPEAIKNLETGILIEPGSAEDLTKAVIKLYNDENLRNNLSKNGTEFVLENFDERVAGRIALETYEKCLTR